MKKLDQRGIMSFEVCIVAVPLFTLMFVIFDLGRYAITVQSLWALASAEARAVMITCYTPDAIKRTSPSGCTTDPLSDAQKQTAAPFLYTASLTPVVAITTGAKGASPLTITASQPNFTMLVPVWGAALNAPSVSTQIPF